MVISKKKIKRLFNINQVHNFSERLNKFYLELKKSIHIYRFQLLFVCKQKRESRFSIVLVDMIRPWIFLFTQNKPFFTFLNLYLDCIWFNKYNNQTSSRY